MAMTPMPDKLWVLWHPKGEVFYALGTTPSEAWTVAIERGYDLTREDRAFFPTMNTLRNEGWRARPCSLNVETLDGEG